MKLRDAAVLLSGIFLAFTFLIPTAHANDADQATRFTFDQPVRVPGRILSPGTYWFVLIDHGENAKLVQIYNSDRTQLLENILTEDASRVTPSGKTILTFAEPNHPTDRRPVTLMAWFYPGFTEGHRFIYSSRREEVLDHENQVTMKFDSNGDVNQVQTVAGD
jgi:hypothetical protein